MNPTDNESSTGEVKNRLDDLFGEAQEDHAPAEESVDLEKSPLRDLKSTILSIDWEISDAILTKLIENVDKLEDTFRQDKDLLLMVKLIGSLGKYIKKNKVNAHPSAIQLLNSTYDSLEKMQVSKELTDSEKRQLLLVQVEKFKKLKEQLVHTKTAASEKKEIKTTGKKEPAIAAHTKDVNFNAAPKPAANSGQEQRLDMHQMVPKEALDYILQEIRQSIRAEFKALREELIESLKR